MHNQLTQQIKNNLQIEIAKKNSRKLETQLTDNCTGPELRNRHCNTVSNAKSTVNSCLEIGLSQ